MSIAEHQDVPAAWYPDRTDPSQLRWWDGGDWTDDVRPMIAAVPQPEAARAEPDVPVMQTRRGLHAVAQHAQGFGHASAEQLRAWPPPSIGERKDIHTAVHEVPREWSAPAEAAPVAPEATVAETIVPETAVAESTVAETIESDLSYSDLPQPGEYFLEEPDEFVAAPLPRYDFFADIKQQAPVVEQVRYSEPLPHVVNHFPDPAPFGTSLTRRQLREMVGPLTTSTLRAE
ncbi:MAG: hypothetical protein JWP19_1072 [Rhodoglobus sp.]|nr:hypothetical protein [Rhodoglobus sp.]